MSPTAARLATLVFWLLIAAILSAIAWRWFGNALPHYVPGVLAALGIAYGVCIIAMNERVQGQQNNRPTAPE